MTLGEALEEISCACACAPTARASVPSLRGDLTRGANRGLPQPLSPLSPVGPQTWRAPWGQQADLREHPHRDINTATLHRYLLFGGAEHRYVPHSVIEVCAFVGEDDTGIDDDDILADGCVPCTGPGEYTISAEGGSLTVNVYNFG